MKAVMLMFDSLNRHMLPPYGCDWVQAPNFQRLADRSVTFDNCYAGSLPCMPARRELHTGRYNFLHRAWSPLEPFDDSMPEMLWQGGVYSHLVSDHYHYWEDGGATYHNRYCSWEISRGEEGDFWKGEVGDEGIPDFILRHSQPGRGRHHLRHDWVNCKYMQDIEDQPMPKTYAAGMEFMRTNHKEDKWFLQLETFDPHTPFFVNKKYLDLYPGTAYDDWAERFRREEEAAGYLRQGLPVPPELVMRMRRECAALISMCDEYLGKVLDLMDELDLWKDTMLIVNTDHGHTLGENNAWGKLDPMYNTSSNTPLFIWDPRSGRQGAHCPALVQTIDLAPTLLEFFGLEPSSDMQGHPLRQTLASDAPVREASLFGQHGGCVNCTDGRYVYMRAPAAAENGPLFDYTLMPTHMKTRFRPEELQRAELAPPFTFSKDCPVLKIPVSHPVGATWRESRLFDLAEDPKQERPIHDARIEAMMTEHILRLMRESEAPGEQYHRLGLPL